MTTRQTAPSAPRPADALPDSWVDRLAPPGAVPYLRLMRADRPIGTWLLFLPCLMGLCLGMAEAPGTISWPTALWYGVLFGAGSFIMRGAGCTYNDIVDRDIDARVARTASRPIPAGQVTARQALILAIALSLAGFVILIQFNRFTILIGLASLGLVAAYPFMKRITWWPQLWLGLTFNWGVLVGFAAVTGSLAPSALILYLATLFWTLGYDTIYAHQDREDDALVGVKSSARALGNRTKPVVAGFYSLTVGLAGGALFGNPGWPLSALLLAPPAIHTGWQVRSLDVNNAHNCLKRFKSNRETGLLLLFPFFVSAVVAAQT